MDDLISRQAAYEVLSEYYHHRTDVQHEGLREALGRVPSAQPDIVRCKECRWGKEACGNIECFADMNVPSEYHGYEWFCPNGERKDDE